MMNVLHQEKTKKLAARVKDFYERQKPFYVFHGSTNSTRILNFKKDALVDLSGFTQVLSVDAKRRTAVVEPNVPMDALVRETLKYGLVPGVVMEFPGITVGGGIQGNGGESGSFKHGAFNQLFNWYELVLANGEIVKVSKDEQSDLFYALPGTAGSLAVLASAEIRLIPAKKYVKLDYIPVRSFAEAKTTVERVQSDDIDFLDGIMFAKDSGVIIVGSFSDKVVGKKQRFSRAIDQWYYLHVQDEFARQPEGWTESVPITDYLFRYDRGAFWVGRFAFEMFEVPYNRFMRWLLNPILHTRKLYQALQESGASQEHVVQDLVLPADKFVEFADFIHGYHQTYPLWLCPMRVDKKSTFQLNNLPTQSIINVGVWGNMISDYDEFLAINKGIESKVLKVGGKKWSYAHSFFTEKQFWGMYDKKLYDALRKKYHATSLPTLYEKLSTKKRYPIEKKKAVYRTIFGFSKIKISK